VAISVQQARSLVLQHVTASLPAEGISLLTCDGRFLADTITADRDYPPFARSARDGFAVRASDLAAEQLPASLKIIGESAAGHGFAGRIEPGECVEIMTGAPLPEGADVVIMVEHVTVEGNGSGARMVFADASRIPQPGDNFNARGCEAAARSAVLKPGHKLGYAEISLLATVGRTLVPVARQPRVAILPTGDEIVNADQIPSAVQIRNSNAPSLAIQVKRAGGIPEMLPIARDQAESTRALIERGLATDLLLLTGGVSAGKYDIVEKVLADLGAEFYFDRVLLQPGAPLVFGRVPQHQSRDRFFFGLPGNPISTMVCFEVFARAAIERMQGSADPALPLLRAQLAGPFKHKPGMTRFLPAHVSADGATVEHVKWQGSGDVPALARANAFLVADPDRESWAAGDEIRVLLR
jgi:molybdopterin molybdotransferase